MLTRSLMIYVIVAQNAANRSKEMSTAVSFQCLENLRQVYHSSHTESTTNDPAIVDTRTCSITSSFLFLSLAHTSVLLPVFFIIFLSGFCWVLSSHPQPYVNVSFQVLLFVDDPLIRWSPMRVVSCLFGPSDALNTVAVNNLRTNDNIPLPSSPPPPFPPPPPPPPLFFFLLLLLSANWRETTLDKLWRPMTSTYRQLSSAHFIFLFFSSLIFIIVV